MRFSLRLLLIFVTLSAFPILWLHAIYQHWDYSRTPILWRDCPPQELLKRTERGDHLIIVGSERNMKTAPRWIALGLEEMPFRVYVAHRSIQCWECIVTEQVRLDEFHSLKQNLGPLPQTLPIILIKRHGKWIIHTIQPDDTIDSLRSRIEKTFERN